ncbi:hypothetical protein Q1695_009290 [Nippostrongylus brasiliensis]|nr:hypothetical protein Q1695_009290 [Nippostrongylus brasiliensis]
MTKGLKIVLESAPEAVPVSPSVCEFSLDEAREDEFVTAVTRENVSTAIRFSERPVSKEAQARLCNLVRPYVPAHPQEGLLPLKVFKISPQEREWLQDRAGDFVNYKKNPAAAQRRMAQVFNVACSALVAVNTISDDKRTHSLTALVPSVEAFPLRLDFTIEGMSSECGWTNRRPVYLWIVGSTSLIKATIQRSEHSYNDRSLAVRLVVPVWSHRGALADCRRFGTAIGAVISVPICVRLGPLPAGADPVYEIISSLQPFSDLSLDAQSRAHELLDTVYGDLQPTLGPVGPPQDLDVVVSSGRALELRPDQVKVLQMAALDLPIFAIQAAYGTGKTVIGALLAARTYTANRTTVIATTTTNTAVAQFTDTLLALDEYKGMDILRFVCDSALLEGTPTTPVDIHTILKRLPDDYGHQMTEAALMTCRKYKRGRELLELFMFDPDRALHLNESEREEYRLAEREVSDITTDVIRVMFEVRPPAVVCLTTSALLNAVTTGGIFSEFLSDAKTVIADEASQIPEPAMATLARFSRSAIGTASCLGFKIASASPPVQP